MDAVQRNTSQHKTTQDRINTIQHKTGQDYTGQHDTMLHDSALDATRQVNATTQRPTIFPDRRFFRPAGRPVSPNQAAGLTHSAKRPKRHPTVLHVRSTDIE